MISLEDAQQFVLDRITALAPVSLSLADALGCVVAESVVAGEALPGFANSSMDGFALRADDTRSGSARLTIVESVRAGQVASRSLSVGEAMRIMTGAPMPDGADSVCMIEDVHVNEASKTVVIPRVVAPGDCVRRPGEDVNVGDVLFSPGAVLRAPGIAVLAGQGRSAVLVYPRPRVGVLSTGNELATSTDALAPGQIRDQNRPLLLALLRQAGATPIDLGVVLDTHEATTQRVRDGVETCDAVVSTGGVSMGDVDFVKTVINELGGVDAKWMQVAIKPAKPFAFGVVGPTRTPVFGLPGNPVSTRVSFELFVRPALRILAGYATPGPVSVTATLDVDLARSVDGKLHLVHVRARMREDGRIHVVDVARRGSHLMHAIVDANALALVPEGTASGVGDVLRVLILDHESLVDPS